MNSVADSLLRLISAATFFRFATTLNFLSFVSIRIKLLISGAASIRTAIPGVKISPVHENRIPAGGGRIGDLALTCVAFCVLPS